MTVVVNPQLIRTYIKKYNLNFLYDNNLIEHTTLYTFAKGDYICEKSIKMENMYFLVEGKLKVFTVLENGKMLLLRFNNALSVLGDIEFLNNYDVMSNVEAVSNCTLLGISFENLRKHAYRDPLFLKFLIENLSYKLYTFSNSTSINLLYPLENRLASYILSTSCDEHSTKFRNEIETSNLKEIAMLLGTSYRHLNRVLNKLVNQGVIERKNKIIKIIDFEKLKALSKDNIYE